jgi:hypothetical protein
LEAATTPGSKFRSFAGWSLSEVALPAVRLPAPASYCLRVTGRRRMAVKTETERLRKYRLMILELLFAERNHLFGLC